MPAIFGEICFVFRWVHGLRVADAPELVNALNAVPPCEKATGIILAQRRPAIAPAIA